MFSIVEPNLGYAFNPVMDFRMVSPDILRRAVLAFEQPMEPGAETLCKLLNYTPDALSRIRLGDVMAEFVNNRFGKHREILESPEEQASDTRKLLTECGWYELPIEVRTLFLYFVGNILLFTYQSAHKEADRMTPTGSVQRFHHQISGLVDRAAEEVLWTEKRCRWKFWQRWFR
jgi:hypothetical protein